MTLFYLIMKDGDSRRWWNADAESWGTRQAATRYSAAEKELASLPTAIADSMPTERARWVGPNDGTED